MILQKKLNYLVIVILALVLVGCGTFPSDFTPAERAESITMDGLNTAYDFRVFALEVASEFWKKGLLDEPDAKKITEIGDEFQDAINQTSIALELYKTSSGVNQIDLDNKILLYQKIYSMFNDLVLPLIIKKMEVK